MTFNLSVDHLDALRVLLFLSLVVNGDLAAKLLGDLLHTELLEELVAVPEMRSPMLKMKGVLLIEGTHIAIIYVLHDLGEGEKEGDLDCVRVASLLGDIDLNPLIVTQLGYPPKV